MARPFLTSSDVYDGRPPADRMHIYVEQDGNVIEFWLDDDYSDADVMVPFESGNFSLHPWQIDDVNLIGYY